MAAGWLLVVFPALLFCGSTALALADDGCFELG